MIDYDEYYDIRLAEREDISSIMAFISESWRKGHILAHNRALFEYDFLEENGDVNFILAIQKTTGRLEGIFGFLKASGDSDHLDIWGSIWRVRDGNLPLLGVELQRRAEQISGCRYRLGIGGNPDTTIPIQEKLLRRSVARMKHYYIYQPHKEHRLIKPPDVPDLQVSQEDKTTEIIPELCIEGVDDPELLKMRCPVLEDRSYIPFKDYEYIRKRYFDYPFYSYQLYALRETKERDFGALLVLREECLEGVKVLRVMDYIGDQFLFSGLRHFFASRLQKENYEYIDFYCHGFRAEVVIKAGFALQRDGDGSIIPDYFHPFEKRNVDIWIHYSAENAVFCKADGDQDRPNL